MSDTARGAPIRYGVALLIAWGGGTMLASLVAGCARSAHTEDDADTVTRHRTDEPA